MKRIGILTAGGDTPALNATIHGAVMRANQLRIEIYGLIKGFNSLFNPRVPHVHLNPLFSAIPELDPTKGGTVLGASRDYVHPGDTKALDEIAHRLAQLKIEGLICIGGDGTLNGLQPICDRLPTVLAPKTIDNDLGLNYLNEVDEWKREPADNAHGHHYKRQRVADQVRLAADDQLRDARLRHGGVRLGRRRAARADHGRKPSPDRHHRGHGPARGLYRPGQRLRPARHRARAGASAEHRSC